MKRLKAGVATREINPEKGVVLGGYPHVVRKNIGVHDSLFASVLYVNCDMPVLFASLDLVGFSKIFSGRVRLEVEKQTKIPRSNIFIMCTHTHSSPYCMPLLDAERSWWDVDEDYVEFVIDSLVSAIIEASSKTFEASVGFGKGICGSEKDIGGNRKNPDGISDPEVNVLSVKDKNGVLRACMANYALHPTFLHAENLYVSADYPGYIREYLKSEEPEAVFLFAQGTSGDQSSRFFRTGQNFDEAKRVGYTLGEAISSIIEETEYCAIAEISVKSKKLDNFLREIPLVEKAREHLIAVQEEYKKLKNDNADYAHLRSVECNIFGAERTLEYAQLVNTGTQLPRTKEEHPMEISYVRINNAGMIFLQGELFVKIGLDIKKASGLENIFVVEMTNGGSAGYIYTKEALEGAGGYEVETSQYSPQMAEYIVEEAIRVMEETQ